MIRMLALMRERKPKVFEREPGIDRQNPERLVPRIEVLVPLEYGNREHVERVEIVLLVSNDNFAAAANDQIDLVVKMTVCAGSLTWRDLCHHDAKGLTVKSDSRIDN